MHSALPITPRPERDRDEPHALPEAIRRQVLRAPAAIETTPVRAALEHALDEARADQPPLVPRSHAQLIHDPQLVALQIAVFGDDVTERGQGSGFRVQ